MQEETTTFQVTLELSTGDVTVEVEFFSNYTPTEQEVAEAAVAQLRWELNGAVPYRMA